MTAIESLPIDAFELSETEAQLARLLFPVPEDRETPAEPQGDVNDAKVPEDAKETPGLFCMLQEVLLLVFCVLLFQMGFWDRLLHSLSNTNQVIVKLLVVVLLIICIKKILSH